MLFRRLWEDDEGAIITVEWLMLASVMMAGLTASFIGLRNRITASVGAMGEMIQIESIAGREVLYPPQQQQQQNVYVQNYLGQLPNP